MSTKVSTAYDNMIARLVALFPESDDWLQIPNAYNIQANPEGFLRKGFALGIGQGVNAKRELSNHMHVDRSFTVSIVREVFKTEDDTEGYGEISKQLFEDLQTVIKDFETNDTLNGSMIFCGYENDGGLQAIEGENFRSIYLQAVFKTTLVENLN